MSFLIPIPIPYPFSFHLNRHNRIIWICQFAQATLLFPQCKHSVSFSLIYWVSLSAFEANLSCFRLDSSAIRSMEYLWRLWSGGNLENLCYSKRIIRINHKLLAGVGGKEIHIWVTGSVYLNGKTHLKMFNGRACVCVCVANKIASVFHINESSGKHHHEKNETSKQRGRAKNQKKKQTLLKNLHNIIEQKGWRGERGRNRAKTLR